MHAWFEASVPAEPDGAGDRAEAAVGSKGGVA